MELKTKKLLSNIAAGIFSLLGGTEYAVIIPTLYSYIESLDGSEGFYGLTFAAFCISGLFASPLFGYLTDRIKRTKLLVLVANMFEIGGNFMYFAATSRYMVLGGRLVSGVGMGAGASIFAQLAWTSTVKERTAVFALVLTMRQLGMVIGPALNVFLEKLDFRLGPFEVNKYTSPGLFMAAVWCLMQLLIIAIYYDLPSIHGSATDERQSNSGVDDYHTKPDTDEGTLKNAGIQAGDSESVESNYEQGETSGYVPDLKNSVASRKSFSWANEYLREEMVLLLGIQFILFFNQCAMESLVVPISIELFGWSSIDNSLFFCGAAVVGILAFTFVRLLSKKVADRWIIAIGLVLETAAVCYMLVFFPRMRPLHDITRNMIIFLFGCLFVIFGLPCFLVGSASLLSKLSSMRVQGTTQGLRRIVINLGIIMGPLWAGALMKKLYIMLGVMVGLQVLMLGMTVLSFKKLKVTKSGSSRVDAGNREETKPLLQENQ